MAGTHTDVPILGRLFDLAINQIRTPVCPLCRVLSFRSLSPAYPHIQLVAECLLSISAMTLRLVIRTWLPPRTLTLPNQDSIFQGLQPSVGLSAHFTRPAVAIVMPSSLRNLTLFDQPWSCGLSYGDRLDPCTSASSPVLHRRPHC